MCNNLKHVFCLFAVLSLVTHYACGAAGDGDPNWNPAPFFPFDSDLVDDFDSPLDDEYPVTWHNTSWITMTTQEGNLILSDPPLWFEGLALGLIEVWKNGRQVMVSDTSIQAVVRLANGYSFVGIYTNTQDGTGDGDAYVGNIFPDGQIRVSRFSGERRSVNTPLDPVNSDVALQFDTIGDRITLSAWAVNKPEAVYSVTWKDEQGPRPLGYMGLGVGGVGPDAVNGQVIVRSFQVSKVQPFFLEDFEDGNASDGNPVTWTILTTGTTGTVSDGSYVLTTNGDAGVEADEFDSIGDVSLRVTARGLTVGSGNYLNLFSHSQPDGRSHWVLVTPLGLHTGSGLPGASGILGTVFQPGAFNPFTGDINIQFDVVGSELSLTVWQPGKAKPSQPQLTSIAPSLPPGRVGFGTDYRQIAIRSFDAIEILSPPMAHWRLDEVEGNIAYDSAGTKDAVVMGDALWLPEGGIVDGALECDGIDDYIETPFVLDPRTGPFSVFAWVKGGQPGQVVISQADVTGGTWLGADLQLGTLMTGLVAPPAGRYVTQPLISDSVITDDSWHHVGFTWDASIRRLYVDGAEVAADAARLPFLQSSEGGLNIGVGGNLDAGTFWAGLIDDVQIDNRVVEPY